FGALMEEESIVDKPPFIFRLCKTISQGYYIVTYALGIYYLNLLIAFLSPKIDPAFAAEEVFWPILVVYFIILFCLTMKRQIKHMIKYRYVPFSFGKPRHTGKASQGGQAFQSK
ncbi:Rer1 family protein, partial [Trichinella nativa]